MKTLFNRMIISLLSLSALPLLSSAQALPFTSADYNPATLARGAASLTHTSSIAYSSFSNAAAIPFSDLKCDVAAGFTMWAPQGVSTNVLNVAGAFNVKQKFGVALGLAYGMNPAYDIYDGSGAVKGQFKPSEMQFNAGLSYRFLPFMSVGANIGYASSKLAQGSSYGSFVADVFLMARFGGFKAAAGVSELGTGITSASGTKYSLPTAASLGLGYETTAGEKHGLDVSLDADYHLSGTFAAGLGASYTYNRLVSLRAGYRYGGDSVIPSFLSVGAGVHYSGFRLDLAYLIGTGETPVSNTLSMSVGYCF